MKVHVPFVKRPIIAGAKRSADVDGLGVEECWISSDRQDLVVLPRTLYIKVVAWVLHFSRIALGLGDLGYEAPGQVEDFPRQPPVRCDRR